MNKSTKPETNRTASTSPPLHGRPLAAQRGRPRLQQFSTKQTTTATVICPRFCPASKREKQGRNRTENEHGSSKHATAPATVREPRAQKSAPILPSARSRNTATTARTRDYTASPLLNKRVRGVVDGGHGLLHLRPRVSTYSAVTKKPVPLSASALHAFIQSAQRGRRYRQNTVCRDWPRQQSRERGEKRGCVWLRRQTESMHQSRLGQRSTATLARLRAYVVSFLKANE